MAVRDRTLEFLENINKASTKVTFQEHRIDYPMEKIIMPFLNRIEEINDDFDQIDLRIQEVIDLQKSILEFSETDQKLLPVYSGIRTDLFHLNNKVTELEKSSIARDLKDSKAELQIYNTQMGRLRRMLASCVSHYYSIQERYKKICIEKVKRHALIVGADITKLNFDEVVGAKTDIFLQTIFPDFDLSTHMVKEIRQRHEAFKRLERSLEELLDLILDISCIAQAHKKFCTLLCAGVVAVMILMFLIAISF